MEKEYELAIHLAGDQTIPNLLGIRNIPAKRHLVLTSEKTDNKVGRLRQVEPEKIIEKEILPDPFDLTKIGDVAAKYAAQVNGPIAANLTGGTKPMAMGTWAWLSSRPEVMFHYFDTQNDRHFHWATGEDVKTTPIDKTLRIDDFIRLSDFQIQEEGVDMREVEDRREVTLKIWKYRYPFTRGESKTKPSIQNAAYNALNSGKNDFPVCNKDKRGLTVEVDYADGAVRSFAFDGKPVQSPERFDLEYLAGRWFEEFTYWTLLPLLENGTLKEMRLGVKVMFDRNENNPAQEFDLLVTDGLRLFVLECKAGIIKQENLDKLENITEKFAGVQGLGVLISRWPLNSEYNQSTVERTEKSNRYACLHGDDLSRLLPEDLLDLKPGNIVPIIF